MFWNLIWKNSSQFLNHLNCMDPKTSSNSPKYAMWRKKSNFEIMHLRPWCQIKIGVTATLKRLHICFFHGVRHDVNTTKLKNCLLFDNYLLCKSWLKQSHSYSNVNKFKIWIPPLDPESDSRILHVKKKPLEIGNICPKS